MWFFVLSVVLIVIGVAAIGLGVTMADIAAAIAHVIGLR
jgi:hypothetical protein